MTYLFPRRALTRLGASSLLLGVLTLVSSAHAQAFDPPTTVLAPAEESGIQDASVCIFLHNASPSVSNLAFVDALSRVFAPSVVWLNCSPLPAHAAQLSVVFSPGERELSVTFFDKERGAITRVVQAPDCEREAPELAAMLARELSRREPGLRGSQAELPSQDQLPERASAEGAKPERVVEAAPAGAAPEADTNGRGRYPKRLANAAVFYPLATNYAQPDIQTTFDVNLLYGLVGAVEGLQLGTVNNVQRSLQGLQVGVLANVVGESLTGAAISGVVGYAGRVEGGFQVAGLANVSLGATDGFQVAFLGNFSGGNLRGAQVALVVNKTGGESRGVQASFGSNIANNFNGAQFAPVLNVARNVRGAQVGLVNVGKRVRGMQIGLVNIAEDMDGFPIGLVSVSKTGGVRVSAWTSYTARANVGLRFATRNTYTIFSLGYHRVNGTDAFGPGLIFGVRVPVVSKFAIDLDIGADYLAGAKVCCFPNSGDEGPARAKDRHHYRVRVLPTWQPYPHFGVYAGGGVALQMRTPTTSQVTPPSDLELYRAGYSAQFERRDNVTALQAWDAYLKGVPGGRFTPEVRYNRALTLAALGRKAEAAQALAPFAAGAYGPLRQSEAQARIDELSGK